MNLHIHLWRFTQKNCNFKKEVTMYSLLTAILYLANQDLIEERVKNNIPEMN